MNTARQAVLDEAAALIAETIKTAEAKRLSGRSSMPMLLDDVYALAALAALGLDAAVKFEAAS